MHVSALENAKRFREAYVSSADDLVIVEIGSQDVNGSLRSLFQDSSQYIGVDFVQAKGVDIVLDDPYQLPLAAEMADVVLCSSVFEHSEFFWLLFDEILRILKPCGLFYLNAPSNGSFHRYPVDCWRFYPDSGAALVKWARRSKYQPELLESFTSAQKKDCWNDYVAVFLKDETLRALYPKKITDHFSDVQNVTRLGEDGFVKFSAQTEDQLVIAELLNASLIHDSPDRSGVVSQATIDDPNCHFLHKWNFDSPKSEIVGTGSVSDIKSIELRGWALGRGDSAIHLAVRQDGMTRSYPFNAKRSDVIMKILKEDPEVSTRLTCGFCYPIRLTGVLEVGFECNGEIHWVKSFNCAAPAGTAQGGLV